MSHKIRKAGPSKVRQGAKGPEQSVFAEAWQNMSADIQKFLPAKFRGGKGKWKFALALALAELVLLGAVGKFIYDWLKG